jgi:hypothetical protein
MMKKVIYNGKTLYTYYPYKSDKPDKKYFIVTFTGKRVYFGAAGYEHYSDGHKDPERKEAYIQRHRKNEDWTKSGIDTPGFWSYHYLWEFPSKTQAYENIKKKYL